MAASDKLILVDNDYKTLETVYQGESLDVNFDLSDLFGETIDPTDWGEVKIYLYQKFSKVNVKLLCWERKSGFLLKLVSTIYIKGKSEKISIKTAPV